jgi:DNA polymerase (family 10)
MSKTKAPHAERLALAEHLLELLRPACERIEIAGSLRRQRPLVGDVELVAIPRLIIGQDMFDAAQVAGSELEDLLATWTCPKPKNGPMYKQFIIDDTQVDLFICEPATWPVTLLIRTGSAEFAQRFVTPRRQGGLLPAGYRVKGWRLQHNGQPCEDITEEEHVFAAIGSPWIPPEERD